MVFVLKLQTAADKMVEWSYSKLSVPMKSTCSSTHHSKDKTGSGHLVIKIEEAPQPIISQPPTVVVLG